MSRAPSSPGFRPREIATALAVYAGAAAIFLFPLLVRLRTHILADDAFIAPGRSDAFNFLWNYWWTLKALSLGRSPFFCDWVLPPTGIDLFYDTHLLVPTVLSWPAAALLGTATGYNLMVLAMIVGAALTGFVFLRITFGFGTAAALAGGAFFGLSPYFLFKAHAHLNLIGGGFWAGGLGTLFHAWARRTFSRRLSLAFAAFAALTFWTSLVETFLAGVGAALVVAATEAAAPRGQPRHVGAKLRFLAPAVCVLAASLAMFLTGRAGGFAPEVFAKLTVSDVFSFSRLSVLFPLRHSDVSEFGGVAFPLAGLAFCTVGFFRRFPHRSAVAILTAALAVVTLDVGGIPSGILRALPLAESFRVFGRFFPLLLFFAAAPFAAGVQALARGRARIALVPLLLLWAAEWYPVALHPSPIKGADVPAAEIATLDPSRFVLLFPSGPYLPADDTWQVALDMPCVLTSGVAHRSAADAAERRRRFPVLYDPDVRGSGPEMLAELRALGVGYLLFEEAGAAQAMGVRSKGRVWPGGEVLVRLPE